MSFASAFSNFVIHVGNESERISQAIATFESLFNAFAPVVTSAVSAVNPKVGAEAAQSAQTAETIGTAVAGAAAEVGQTLAPPAP